MTTIEAIVIIKSALSKGLELESRATRAPWSFWADEGSYYSICIEDDEGHTCIASVAFSTDDVIDGSNAKIIPLARNQYPILARLITMWLTALEGGDQNDILYVEYEAILQAAEELQKGE